MLVAAMNPSPSGSREGRSTAVETQRYLNKISGPLLDRIDIHIEVPAVKHETLLRPEVAESSATIRRRVVKARQRQTERFSARKTRCNAQMTTKDLKTYAVLDSDSETFLRMALGELKLSARAYDRILKVARTVADLAGRTDISENDISEAIQYRSLDRQIWG